jgi:hypothetical protein
MTESVKNISENYYKPTPKRWRKIGDAIQDVGLIVGTVAFFTPAPWITPVSFIIGRLGKIITNFASE